MGGGGVVLKGDQKKKVTLPLPQLNEKSVGQIF